MPVRLVVTGACLAALLLPSAAARADNPLLEGFVGANDSFSISLLDASGTRVTHLDAGSYTIKIHDLSELHDFHLSGPGVDQATSVDDKQEVTWTVTLTNGTYTFVCDPHASFMKGSFTVGSAQPPPPPPPRKCKVPRVIGKKLPTARQAITRARCRVGRVRRARSRRARGRVVSQSPRAGVTRARGTRVNLVVSRGRR